jgi:hypothetical protein
MHKVSILTVRRSTSLTKLPITSLAILSNILALQELIKRNDTDQSTKENKLTKNELKLKILATTARSIVDLISILMILEVTGLFGKRENAINLLPTILPMIVSQPIDLYFAYKKYSKDRDYTALRKSAYETATLVLAVSSFLLNNVIKTQDIPVVLGPDLIYNFNFGTVIGMTCTLVSIFSTLDTLLFTQSFDDPGPKVDTADLSIPLDQHDQDIPQVI